MRWVWTDDLARRLLPEGAGDDPGLRRLIDAPVAVRVAVDAGDDLIASMLGLVALVDVSSHPAGCIADLSGRVDQTGDVATCLS